MSNEEILAIFKKYTTYGCSRSVELDYKTTNETRKFKIPNTELWLYKCGEDIELIAQEPHIKTSGDVEHYSVWDTKDVPVIASMGWRGYIYAYNSYIGEL